MNIWMQHCVALVVELVGVDTLQRRVHISSSTFRPPVCKYPVFQLITSSRLLLSEVEYRRSDQLHWMNTFTSILAVGHYEPRSSSYQFSGQPGNALQSAVGYNPHFLFWCCWVVFLVQRPGQKVLSKIIKSCCKNVGLVTSLLLQKCSFCCKTKILWQKEGVVADFRQEPCKGEQVLQVWIRWRSGLKWHTSLCKSDRKIHPAVHILYNGTHHLSLVYHVWGVYVCFLAWNGAHLCANWTLV